MYKIDKKNLLKVYKLISEKMLLVVPTNENGTVNFKQWHEHINVDLDIVKTVLPAKQFFLPTSEKLYTTTFDVENIKISHAPYENSPFVIFGVRACDMAGIEHLDGIYLKEPIDRFYEARRNMGLIVTLACTNQNITCFCKSFDIDASNSKGDVSAWIHGDNIFLQSNTTKGENFINIIKTLVTTVDDVEVNEVKNEIKEKVSKLQYSNLQLDKIQTTEKTLLDIFNSAKWDKINETCLSCSTCTFLCPTCSCYDITDFDTGKKVICHRNHDSCMNECFTQMAHGNPRTSGKQRFRQRFMHKLVYNKESTGKYGCVGCGRCISKCPVNINIIKVIKALGEDKDV